MSTTIYISEYLSKTDRGKPIVKQLQKQRDAGRFTLTEIPENKNEWCRDYMPVRVANGKLVLFCYRPPYLLGTKSGEASIPNQKKICADMGLVYVDATSIRLDGGAIEVFKDTALISERFLNLDGVTLEVKEKIRRFLGLKRVVSIPPDPWDFTGHVDGLVRFIDENTVLINDYTELEQNNMKESRYIQKKYGVWKTQFNSVLQEAGFSVEHLPSAFHLNSKSASARGVYLNFLLLESCILMPAFRGLEVYNQAAKEKLEKLYRREVLEIEADSIAEKGGVINCISWNTYSDT